MHKCKKKCYLNHVKVYLWAKQVPLPPCEFFLNFFAGLFI